MKRLTYLFAILLISSAVAWADETITVTATNSDISANLDLKIVAKLFGEAKDLEDFEKKLNDPQQALVNLDLNGDGDVDYIRVIETTNGNKHLIVLQAVLAKDIYQDVASIYVEKDEANNVSVQVIGDEYIYGKNYVIEPVYIYRPVIYDWFWGPYWTCWTSPWYWGFWPGWWAPYACIGYHAYYNRCYDYHHHHYGCSFHYAKEARPSTHRMAEGVSRQELATAHPETSFATRNAGVTNARELASPRQSSSRSATIPAATATHSAATTTYSGGSTRTSAATATEGHASNRSYTTTHTVNSNASARTFSGATATRSTATATATRSTASTTHSTAATTRSATSNYTPTYSGSSTTRSSYSSGNSSYSGGTTRTTYSSGSGYSGGSTRSSFSGAGSSAGSSRSYSGSHSVSASSRGSGAASTRR